MISSIYSAINHPDPVVVISGPDLDHILNLLITDWETDHNATSLDMMKQMRTATMFTQAERKREQEREKRATYVPPNNV